MKPLTDPQAKGAEPRTNAWLSASAGTGKTQVLSSRVLRLLLAGTPPDRILGLTFTRAAAAEMQSRIRERLAGWAGMGDNALIAELAAIRAPTDCATRDRARRLFATVLDCRGGLAVSTLHGFAQSLLAGFPLEAGIAPGFEALDERSGAALHARILGEAIDAAAREGDAGFAADLAQLAIAGGEQKLAAAASRLLAHGDAIASFADPRGFEPALRRLLALPAAVPGEELIAGAVAAIDRAGLQALAAHNRAYGGANALKCADRLEAWLAFAPADAAFEALHAIFVTTKGTVNTQLVPGKTQADPAMKARTELLAEAVLAAADTIARLATVATAARHLRIGHRLAAAHAAAKHALGVIDYGDMIARARALLAEPGMGEWVRYKLDRRYDHLLVDEAQDTNADQWEIVEALTGDFWAGQGAHDEARDGPRTLFVVGDFKQSIMSFQGTDPKVFRDRQEHFAELIDAGRAAREELALADSFRSVPAVLEIVDGVAARIGPVGFGLRDGDTIPPHAAARADLPGSVTLWPPLAGDETGEGLGGGDDDTGWIPPAQVAMAQRLARQIAAWLDPLTPLHLPARGRHARAEDILVLVRSRGDFVGAFVAALHANRVPVAGADRLKLTQPLAVRDLLALIRFVLQPDDDLTLATLMVSPFLGLSYDRVEALAPTRGKRSLWSQLRDATDPELAPAQNWLREALALADFTAPYEFLETILSGPAQGRRKLLARLGSEACDAIDALLAEALKFETANAPSLQGFLAWIEADDVEAKRDPDAPLDAVRIMTVHGAKGLQAPVVVLADAAKDPGGDRDPHVMLPLVHDGPELPVFHGGKAGKRGRVGEAAEAAEARRMEEHWRLLYVALTRAEDLLFVGGALPSPRGEKPAVPAEHCWWLAVHAAMAAQNAERVPSPLWDEYGPTLVHLAGSAAPVADAARPSRAGDTLDLPAWATALPAPEARPPRPLSPSALAADDIAAPPPSPALARAAKRGQLLHRLFERLPAVVPADRAAAAAAWLAASAPDFTAAEHTELARTVLDILAEARFAALFGPEALAEAPIAALVGGTVVAGTVDRLHIGPDAVRVVDFKTGRAVPASAEAVPRYHLAQMSAYAAALAQIFPGRAVAAALLYTEGARLIELPPALLAAHRPSQLGG